MDIAKRIKALREEYNLTQEQLAKELNVSRNAISNYENGIRNPDLNLIIKLCEIFNISLSSFFQEEIVYNKPSKAKILKPILQIAILVMLVITCILSIVLYDKAFSNDISVDDKTKVEKSNEISLINVTNKIDNKTYEVEIIDKLKGNEFSYIKIKDRDIKVNINTNYLVFGNRISINPQYKNYVSYDIIEINSYQYIQELSGEDVLNHPTVNYYKELIKDERKEDVLVANLLNPRNEEYIISSKDKYQNPYDSFDLNKDFDVSFKDAYYQSYKYMNIEISMKMTNDKLNKIVYLYSDDNLSDYKNVEEYTSYIKNEKTNNICIHYVNIDMTTFTYNTLIISLFYSYSSILDSSWTTSDLNVKVIYRK